MATMTVIMLNQTGNHDHYHITKDLEVTRKQFNDEIHIYYISPVYTHSLMRITL